MSTRLLSRDKRLEIQSCENDSKLIFVDASQDVMNPIMNREDVEELAGRLLLWCRTGKLITRDWDYRR